jgi:putative membrane protein
MKRQVPLLTTILFAGATALMAQAQAPAPRTKPVQPTTPKTTTSASTKTSNADLAFVKKVAAGGEAEVELAKLAQQKGTSEEVKSLASRLETDHMKANDELKKIASQKGWTLPTEPTAEQKAKKAKLEKLSGAAFDRDYADTMVTNHRNNIPMFEREASSASDPDLKQWASSIVPTLKEHLDMAQKAQKSLGSNTSRGATKPTTKSSDKYNK